MEAGSCLYTPGPLKSLLVDFDGGVTVLTIFNFNIPTLQDVTGQLRVAPMFAGAYRQCFGCIFKPQMGFKS